MTDADEPWKEKKDEVKYVPLQAKVGDLAVYLNKSGWEIEFNKEKYIILPPLVHPDVDSRRRVVWIVFIHRIQVQLPICF